MQNFTEKDLFQHISVDTEPMCGEVDAILLIVGAVITNINNNNNNNDSRDGQVPVTSLWSHLGLESVRLRPDKPDKLGHLVIYDWDEILQHTWGHSGSHPLHSSPYNNLGTCLS